ncbi:MAG: HD-GYP domain-containing protein [Pseudothermotoga sp.]
MKKIRSLKDYMKRTMLLVSIFIGICVFVMGWTIYEIYLFDSIYQRTRLAFNQVNDVVAGRSHPSVVIEEMRHFNYSSERYENLLKNYDESLAQKESIINELRSFANFLREYEAEYIRKHKDQIRKVYGIIFIASLVLLIFSYRSFALFRFFVDKVLRKTSQIAGNVYVSPIPIDEPSCEEELKINDSINDINTVFSIYETLRETPLTTSTEDFVFTVGPYLCKLFNSQRFSVAFIDWDNSSVIAEVAYISKSNIVPRLTAGFSQKLEETSLGEMIKKEEKTRIINDIQKRYELTKSKSLGLLIEEGFKSNLTLLASINSRPFGFLFLTSDKTDNYTEYDESLFAAISTVISYRLYYSLILQKLLSSFANSLVNLVEFKDNETGNHIKRVAGYAKAIAQELNLSPRLVREIYQFSSLHDIGKVAVPDRILLKPGRLDLQEWEIMKKHVEKGLEVIENFEKEAKNIIDDISFRTMKNIIADHHEHWDGKGYPCGKKKNEISIEGRIVGIADVFDALTTKRPYKEPFSFDESVAIISKESGSHFDPDVVQAFFNRIDEIELIYEKLKD